MLLHPNKQPDVVAMLAAHNCLAYRWCRAPLKPRARLRVPLKHGRKGARPPRRPQPSGPPGRAAVAAAAAAPSSAAPFNSGNGGGDGRGPLQKDAHQLAQLLLQLSRLEVRPHAQWLREALDEVQRQMPLLPEEDVCACMRALSSWGHAPGAELLEAVEARALSGIARGSFTTRQMAELAWTYAQLGLKHRPLLPVILTAAEADMRAPNTSCPPEAMADLLWSMARLQHQPVDARWLSAFYSASRGRLREFDAQQMARAVWALARLGAVPPAEWMDAFLASSLANLRGFDVKSTSLTLWALATLSGLGCPRRPSGVWLAAFEGQAELGVRQLGAAEAATSLWALSQLMGKPPQRLRLSAALRRPQPGLSQLDFELLSDIKMLRVVRSMITPAPAAN